MILKLSVGKTVQVSHIVKMRLRSQKRNDHTTLFMSSDPNERHNARRMVLSRLPLDEGEETKGTLPLVAGPERTHNH